MPAENSTHFEEEDLQSQFEEVKEPAKRKKAAKKKANNKKKAKTSNKMNQAVDEDENPEECIIREIEEEIGYKTDQIEFVGAVLLVNCRNVKIK